MLLYIALYARPTSAMCFNAAILTSGSQASNEISESVNSETKSMYLSAD